MDDRQKAVMGSLAVVVFFCLFALAQSKYCGFSAYWSIMSGWVGAMATVVAYKMHDFSRIKKQEHEGGDHA